MFNIIKPDTKYDFMGQAPVFTKVSLVLFVLAIVVITVKGVNLGLDFAGGHEILLEFPSEVRLTDVRQRLNKLFPTVDTSVQSFEVPDNPATFYLTRIERSETFGEKEIQDLNKAFRDKYGEQFSSLDYNPEAGDVVEVEFAATATAAGADTSTVTIASVVGGTDHEVRLVRPVGRPSPPRFAVVLKGVDVSVVNAMNELDPGARAARVEFVGPTIGKQLRDDGLLAVLYALLCILIYIALRFDFYFSPGAILCLFHDAVITVAILSLLGEEFTLATIAGLLTLVGYSINDTIVVFDRIRETISKVQGASLVDILNRAINETLGRTIMTSFSTLVACVCLIVFGRGTVLASFGRIMTVGILIGTYSSIYVAAPAFRALRERFGPRQVVGSGAKKRAAAAS